MLRGLTTFRRKILEIAAFFAVFTAIGGICFAETGFVPGAVFREYRWYGPWRNANTFQRVTDPRAGHSGAKEFLPNPVNHVTIGDLEHAVRAEVCIEVLQSHAGTHNKRIRLNGNEWMRIPEADEIPGDNPECYQTLTYPVLKIPLSYLNEGENSFELTTDGQICHNFRWGQFIIYGVTFRIFYDESKSHPTGSITFPLPGATIGENPMITVDAASPDGIKQVDFIGYYEDFNFKGDNIWRQWQYRLYIGLLRNHLGTVKEEPYSITWDTEWVPDQDEPLKIMARIIDKNGMQYITQAVEGIPFTREGRSVKLYKPYNVPTRWASRAGQTHACKALVSDDLGLAVEARMSMMTWAGTYAEKIGINNIKVVSSTGSRYASAFSKIPVPLDLIRPGENSLFTYSSTQEHGIEVNWPGIVLKIVYEKSTSVGDNSLEEESNAQPVEYALYQNRPNPFNPATTIEYRLTGTTQVKLTVYNYSGQKIAELKNGVESSGRYSVTFDASEMPSGLYFFRLEAGEYTATKKMLLIK